MNTIEKTILFPGFLCFKYSRIFSEAVSLFHSRDFNKKKSPYCLRYIPYDIKSENLLLNQMISFLYSHHLFALCGIGHVKERYFYIGRGCEKG